MSKRPISKADVTFREMSQKDVDSVLKIERSIYAFPWTSGNFKDCLASNYRCQIVMWDDKLIAYGVQMSILDEMHLLNLTVASEFQKMGIGRLLLDFFIEDALTHQAIKMILEVRRTNLGAIFLYESSGFNQIGLRKNYYPAQHGREDAIVMEISL